MFIAQDRKLHQVSRHFSVEEVKTENTHKKWHYHPEFELFIVNACSGIALIGNTVKYISPGDIILIGPNLPHAFDLEPSPFEPFSYPDTKLTRIKFESEFFQEEMLYTQEFLPILNMFNGSRRGLFFHNDYSLSHLGTQLSYKEGAELILLLINVLDQLSKKTDKEFVSTSDMYNILFDKKQRLDSIITFLFDNYTSNIYIKDIAKVAQMTNSSFCRYFKQLMDRQFTSYLNELRVQEAIRLMHLNRLSVSEIAIQVGFMSITNFNRQFKQITQMTPLQYRKKFLLS